MGREDGEGRKMGLEWHTEVTQHKDHGKTQKLK